MTRADRIEELERRVAELEAELVLKVGENFRLKAELGKAKKRGRPKAKGVRGWRSE